MRKLLTIEQVNANAEGIKKQLARFIDFDAGKAMLVNNADWLTRLEYIPFLRDQAPSWLAAKEIQNYFPDHNHWLQFRLPGRSTLPDWMVPDAIRCDG